MIGGDLGAMMARHARPGRVDAIFIRPARRGPIQALTSVRIASDGLNGDHARAGKRAVTLIQSEHLPVISALLANQEIDPGMLRRNIVVSGINLLALRAIRIQIDDCILHIHGPCPPCSRMEESFGPGGYSAVRGHGGVYAEVLVPGQISIGSTIARCMTE
ncbi:MOSC domain-containing protein [Boseongicola aestuarii]|uniref:MOSC domain protein n=1 Tax=Boseongicola aestuarii TaxID=1470561 RepID=A0A238IWN0_9RHOB|nr:MOSC domain-containing protein [Boseongicola aestuarii]SMX22150.1 MOSC domain protein [Boseongicola aestuarii]